MPRKHLRIRATEIAITPPNLQGDRSNPPDAKLDKDTFNVWIFAVAEDEHSVD